MRRIEKDNGVFQLSYFHIITAVIFFSIVFEIILPSISMEYTGDKMDILCYVLGGIIFRILNRKNEAYSFSTAQSLFKFSEVEHK